MLFHENVSSLPHSEDPWAIVAQKSGQPITFLMSNLKSSWAKALCFPTYFLKHLAGASKDTGGHSVGDPWLGG